MEHADERLRAAGLRVTRPRLAILAEISAYLHADVELIATGARVRIGSLSTQAFYDVSSVVPPARILTLRARLAKRHTSKRARLRAI